MEDCSQQRVSRLALLGVLGLLSAPVGAAGLSLELGGEYMRWEEFADVYFAKMEATGVVKSMKDFYWDIRPKPEYGTIELRVCDTPLTVERAAALACYLQALCRHLLARNEPPPEEDDYLVYTYNRFQACRFGLEGQMVNPKTCERIGIREEDGKRVPSWRQESFAWHPSLCARLSRRLELSGYGQRHGV